MKHVIVIFVCQKQSFLYNVIFTVLLNINICLRNHGRVRRFGCLYIYISFKNIIPKPQYGTECQADDA